MSSSGPVYVITGASRGLGLGYAQTLLDRDSTCRIVATARNPDSAEHLHALKQKLGSHARRLHVVKMDVVSSNSCGQAAQSVEEFAPDGIDALIVNAGVLGGGFNGLAPDSVATLKENMEVNVYGAINSVNAFLPLLRKKENGKKQIFLLGSIMGSIGGPMGSSSFGLTYSMSKAAVSMLGKKLSAELDEEGFTVMIVHPGYVSTDMNGGTEGPATLSVAESVEKTIDLVVLPTTRERNGTFYQYDGTTLPW